MLSGTTLEFTFVRENGTLCFAKEIREVRYSQGRIGLRSLSPLVSQLDAVTVDHRLARTEGYVESCCAGEHVEFDDLPGCELNPLGDDLGDKIGDNSHIFLFKRL